MRGHPATYVGKGAELKKAFLLLHAGLFRNLGSSSIWDFPRSLLLRWRKDDGAYLHGYQQSVLRQFLAWQDCLVHIAYI